MQVTFSLQQSEEKKELKILVESQLTDITAPSSCSNHLVVNCQKSNQENRRKQKIFAIPPQLLQGEKLRDHVDCGTKLAPEQVIRRTPPLCYQGETPGLNASPPSWERTRRPASRPQLLPGGALRLQCSWKPERSRCESPLAALIQEKNPSWPVSPGDLDWSLLII